MPAGRRQFKLGNPKLRQCEDKVGPKPQCHLESEYLYNAQYICTAPDWIGSNRQTGCVIA